MAIIVADSRNASYDGNISTVNGFYRMEAGNLGCLSNAVVASLTSTVQYAVTFANAGNCMGIVLPLVAAAATVNRPILVELQENVASVWTTRTSKSLTALEILCSPDNADTASVTTFLTPFKFATPYAVDTTASKWRFQISSTAGTSNWNIKQAVAGTPSWVTWCDNTISWTDNSDQFVAVDTLIINQATTFLGALATGDAVNSYAGWVCSGPDKDPNNVAMLKWATSPASSYKLTIKGKVAVGSNSGFRVGTQATPNPISGMAEIQIVHAAVGTDTNVYSSGFVHAGGTSRNVGMGGVFLLYGEIPSVEDEELFAAASAGQPVVVTKNATGWATGDKVVIGRQTTRGNTDPKIYTISTVVGTTITLTENLVSARSINASIIRMNGYGIKIYSTETTGNRITPGWECNNFVIEGCEVSHLRWTHTYVSGPTPTSIGTDIPHKISHCSFTTLNNGNVNFFTGNPATGVNMIVAYAGFSIDHCNQYAMMIPFSMTTSGGQGVYNFTNNIVINHSYYAVNAPLTMGIWNISNNKFENSTYQWFSMGGIGCTLRNNLFWGNSSGASGLQGIMRIENLHNTTDWGGNTVDNCVTGFFFALSPNLGNKSYGDTFGPTVANTSGDVSVYQLGYATAEFENTVGTCTPYIVRASLTDIYAGTEIRIIKNNGVEGADTIYKKEGTFYKAGTGLTDTTKHTETYSLKFVPYKPLSAFQGIGPLTWSQKIPTENIQNQNMMVGIWIKLDNAAYWAGTHQMPRLSVNYDNGTVAYSEALQNTNWQFVSVPFTPVTTYGEITVSVSGKTDALVANAAFYAAEMSVLYPAGHNIDMGKMNTWSSALPTMPSISTTISAGDVWAVDPDSFGAGTVGETVVKTKKIVTGLQ